MKMSLYFISLLPLALSVTHPVISASPHSHHYGVPPVPPNHYTPPPPVAPPLPPPVPVVMGYPVMSLQEMVNTLSQMASSLQQSTAHINSIAPGRDVRSAPVPHGTSADCALLLQRMYIDTRNAYRLEKRAGTYEDHAYASNSHPPASSPNPNYSFDQFLALFSNNEKTPALYGAVKELCIRFADINKAIAVARDRRGFTLPRDINTLEPAPASIAEVGELNQEVTKILAYDFELSPDEILNGLPLIDMSRTAFWDVCPAHVKPIPCTVERFRTYTGHCNNLKHPAWGASNTPFVRYLPPVHPDGKFHLLNQFESEIIMT